jgi:asparagine synthase (glutamine-hydrolysing)
MGFGVPVSRWFRKELKDYVFEILFDRRTSNRGFFRREGVKQLLDEHLALQYDHSAKIWALLVLEIWFRIFMDQEGNFFSFGV